MLPWPALTVFAVLAGATAAFHLGTAVLAFIGSRHRALAWRLTGFLSIGFLAYVTYAAIGSGLYVNLLYEGVGTAILAASVAAWCVAVLFLLPLSAWGIATTGGLLPWRRAKKTRAVGAGASIAGGVVLLGLAAATSASAARGVRHIEETDVELDEAMRLGFARLPASNEPTTTAPTLFTTDPVACARSPHEHEGATLFVSFLELPEGASREPPRPEPSADSKDPKDLKKEAKRPEPRATLVCLQGYDLESTIAQAHDLLVRRQAFSDAVVDVVVSSRALPDAGPLLGPIVVRPGYEAVCDRERCLTSWQLFGLDAFTEAADVSALQAQIGVTAVALRRLLAAGVGGFEGLDALRTKSYLIRGRDRSVSPMLHLRMGPRPLDPSNVEASIRESAAFIAASQVKDGRFRYTVQPFTGVVSFDNFSVPRQAGTTLALCDAAAFSPKAKEVAKSSLGFLVTLEQKNGEHGGIIFPKGRTGVNAGLGSTALSLIALFSCRELVGTAYDETILRLASTVLQLQRKDGGFAPAWNPATDTPVLDRDALYAAGQALYALVLWEGAAGEGIPRPEGLRAAIDRAMDYYSGPYWDIPLRDFFWLEENWHCMAARVALASHRHGKYEKFCIDYMTMKMRLIQTPSSGVDEDHVGSYAFGHVFPPHHGAAAGFLEGLAASVALKRARNESVVEEEKLLRMTVSYLLRHQWRDDNCSMCTRKLRIPGGFSENAASPIIRIDFVQHAMSGMLHAARQLALVREG